MSQNATQQAVLVTQIDPRRFWSKQLLKVCLLQQKENVRSSRLCQQAFLTRITPCVSKCTWTNIQSKYWTYAFNIRKDLFTSPPRKAREDEAAGNSGSFTQPPLPYLLLLRAAAAQLHKHQQHGAASRFMYSWVLLVTGRINFLLTCYILEGKYWHTSTHIH